MKGAQVTAMSLVLWVACVATTTTESLEALPEDGDPSQAFDAWAAVPPPPLTTCAGAQAVLGGTPYASSAQATLDAQPGDTIWLCPGVHRDPLRLSTVGRYSIAGITGDPSDVVIDGQAHDEEGIVVRDGYQVQIRNVTFSAFDYTNQNAVVFGGADAADILNVVFEGGYYGEFLEVIRTRWLRVTDITMRRSNSRVLTVACETFPTWAWPQCTVNVQRLLVEDQYHPGSQGIALMGAENDPSHPQWPQLTATLDDVVIRDSTWDANPIFMSGDSYHVTFNRLVAQRNTIHHSIPAPHTCAYDFLAVAVSSIPDARAIVTLRDPTIEDNVVWSVYYGNHDHVVIPSETLSRIDGGRITRNTACEAAVTHGPGAIAIRNVDFGDGPDDNTPADWRGICSMDDVPPGTLIAQARPASGAWAWCR